jgi:DNA adenine methylase
MPPATLRPPFPYVGGKRRVAAEIWARLGTVGGYIEAFAGSLAVLLARPGRRRGREAINDSAGEVANFWRAAKVDPLAVADAANRLGFEVELLAVSNTLQRVREELTGRLKADPGYYDAELAGWYAWGVRASVGRGFCMGERQHMVPCSGGLAPWPQVEVVAYYEAISNRLRGTAVLCGDWSRPVSRPYWSLSGPTAIFLDPPYAGGSKRGDQYVHDTGEQLHRDVEAWCVETGRNQEARIALAGYVGTYPEIESAWASIVVPPLDNGLGPGVKEERIWFSAGCLTPERQTTIFDIEGEGDVRGE